MYTDKIHDTNLASMVNDLGSIRQRAATEIVQIINNDCHIDLTHGQEWEFFFDSSDPDQYVHLTYGNDPSDVKRYPIRGIRVVPDKEDADESGYIALPKMWQDIEVLIEFDDGETEWNHDIYDTTPDEMVYLLRALLSNVKRN